MDTRWSCVVSARQKLHFTSKHNNVRLALWVGLLWKNAFIVFWLEMTPTHPTTSLAHHNTTQNKPLCLF